MQNRFLRTVAKQPLRFHVVYAIAATVVWSYAMTEIIDKVFMRDSGIVQLAEKVSAKIGVFSPPALLLTSSSEQRLPNVNLAPWPGVSWFWYSGGLDLSLGLRKNSAQPWPIARQLPKGR